MASCCGGQLLRQRRGGGARARGAWAAGEVRGGRGAGRTGDRAGVVGGAEEEDLGEVDGRVEVVVHEGRVLRRVEHLEQRRRGVALVAAAQLVDFVNEHHRVRGARRLEALDQLARHRTHVRPPVALDLGDVGQAAHREAVELAAECARDGLADRRLADAGRACSQLEV